MWTGALPSALVAALSVFSRGVPTGVPWLSFVLPNWPARCRRRAEAWLQAQHLDGSILDRVERHAADCVAGWEHQFDARVGAAHRHGAASRASFLAQAEKCVGDMVIALLARLAQASTRVDTR